MNYTVEDSYVVAYDEPAPDQKQNGVSYEPVEEYMQELDKCAYNEMSNQSMCFLEFQQI